MPVYMDRHYIEETIRHAVADAHQKDLPRIAALHQIGLQRCIFTQRGESKFGAPIEAARNRNNWR